MKACFVLSDRIESRVLTVEITHIVRSVVGKNKLRYPHPGERFDTGTARAPTARDQNLEVLEFGLSVRRYEMMVPRSKFPIKSSLIQMWFKIF